MKSPKQIKKVNELKCVMADLHDLQTNFVQQLRALQPFAENASQEVGDVFRCMIQRQNYLCTYHKRLPPILDMCSVTSTKIAGDQLCAATPAHNPDLHKLEMLYETLMTESIELNAVIHAYGRGIVSSDIRKLRMHSMVVELVNPQTDERKLRYLLLFSDILVCAKIVRKDSIKQKNSVFNERLKSIRHKDKSSQSIRNFPPQRLHSKSPDLLENSDRGDPAVRLETKWMIPLNQLVICVNQRVDYDNLKMSEQERKIEQLKFSLSTFRSGKRHLAQEGSSTRLRRLEHSITKLEGRLVLQTPQLILPISDNSGQVRQILLVTERERNHWRTALETAVYQVKQGLASKNSNNKSCGVLVSTFDGLSEKRTNAEQCSPRITHSEMNELLKKYQYLIRLNKTGMALLKDHGVPGITGILRTTVHGIQGLNELDSYHVWIEVDSYAQFEELARTRVVAHQPNPEWNQTFDLQIDEAHRICFTIYRHCDVFAELEVKLTEDCICNKVISMPLKTKEATPRTITFTFSLSLCKPSEVRNRSVTTKYGRVFGHPLPDLVRRDYGEQCIKSTSDLKNHSDSNKSKDVRVPKIVVACTDEIERRGLREVGIYRVCGSNNDIQAVKELIDQDLEEGIKRLSSVEIFVVASLLKQFFRELPESLLTGPGSMALMQTAENPNEENRIQQMKTIINSLPAVNRETFVHLVMHLLTVNRYKEVNMMDLSNLALLWSTALFQTITRHQSLERTPANSFDSLNQEAAVSFQQTKTLHIILQAVQDNFLAFEESAEERDISDVRYYF
ncbi:Active breakpoint cluster region protein [Paragonimus heterotremus]|uniref:Active breakpoint cluster region protein n=1 Tax=Paragonimus heterotremus TaxID=100268 RepID=A0A8J4WKE3_9TREM|nr:Active breakpoint cluster region protein [Paragonimus heterotremus]